LLVTKVYDVAPVKMSSLVVAMVLVAASLHAQAPAPGLTPAQIAASEAMAAKLDRSEAREQARLANFKGRPLGAVIQRAFDIGANDLLLAAEMMPESSYTFRPTMDVRNFGDQINHSTVSHYSFCNQAGLPSGVARQSAPSLAQLTMKAQIVKALDDSISYCNAVLLAASEAWLMELAPRVGGATSGLVEGIRAHAFMYNNVHDTEDYGTITTYLRLNGIVPPSSALHPQR
jgi:hypothetical protein